jgi:hypothetical protein
MNTRKIVLAFCTTLAMIGGVIQYANSMPSSNSNLSEVLLTPGEMESVFAGTGGGGSGGDTGGGGGGTVDASSQYHWVYYGVGPFQTLPVSGSIPALREIGRGTVNAGTNLQGQSGSFVVTVTACYKSMQRPAYDVNDWYYRWKKKVHNTTGATLTGSETDTGETYGIPRTIAAGNVYFTPC